MIPNVGIPWYSIRHGTSNNNMVHVHGNVVDPFGALSALCTDEAEGMSSHLKQSDIYGLTCAAI